MGSKSIPMDKIRSLTIIYNDVHGTNSVNSYSGHTKSNGEKNILTIKLISNKAIQYNFKLASIGHAEKLLKLTDKLKKKIAIRNVWKLSHIA